MEQNGYQTVTLTPAQAEHNNKATTGMVLSIIGLALILLPGLNVPGLVLSIVGFCIANKNRKFAAANGFKECSSNTAGWVCGLIGIIVQSLVVLLAILAVILFIAVGVTAATAFGPTIQENLPAISDAIENALPTVESYIGGLSFLL